MSRCGKKFWPRPLLPPPPLQPLPMCECIGSTLRLVLTMSLVVFGCFAIVSLSPTDSTVRPLVLRTKNLHTINQVQPATRSVSGSPPPAGATKGTVRPPGPAADAAVVPAAFVPWDGNRGLERWQSASFARGAPKSVFAWKRPARPAAPAGDECLGHGVYNPLLEECRCTAGWSGRLCHARRLRPCNSHTDPRARLNSDALCAGNCDDERGLCYCAGLKTPFQRSLPHTCAPATTADAKLPDSRPLYPRRQPDGSWAMANMIWESGKAKAGPRPGPRWARPWAKPIELVYGRLPGNPELQPKGHGLPAGQVGWCEARSDTSTRQLAIRCAGCYEGRTGPLCEQPKAAFCLRDCTGHGRCDSGFCWCDAGWFGVDCAQSTRAARGAPAMQAQQRLPSPAAASPLRIYVYDMPSEFTTLNLQWRNGPTMGNHRAYTGENRSYYTGGSLYAMETALHEWLLDSPLRTTDAAQAHLFFVPVYLASLFMWPISKVEW